MTRPLGYPDHVIDIAEKFFKLKPESEGSAFYVSEDKKTKIHLEDWSEDSLVFQDAILKEMHKEGWVFNYSTMNNGKRGHFVKVGFLQSPFLSYYTHKEGSGENLLDALVPLVLQACKEIEDYEFR